MKQKTSWNPVLNKFIEIKYEYKKCFNRVDCSCESNSTTCLKYWVTELVRLDPRNEKYKEYLDILSCLELNQSFSFLLIRYGKYSDIYNGEVEASGEELWGKYDGFYRECRSIVIDTINDCIVLCPFAKFFNINELEETSLQNIQERIDKAKNIEFSDKLDGSMQSARWYDDRIIMAGSQAISPDNSWRLKDGYEMIFKMSGYEKMLKQYPDYTFIFEYISLKDAHIVKYSKEQEGLYLIGIRDVNTGKEFDYHTVLKFAQDFSIPRLTTNYRCLKTMYSQRKNHRLPEWREFCEEIKKLPYAKELIIGEEKGEK